MLKKILVSAALFASLSSNAFADSVTDYANELLAAKQEISNMLAGNASPAEGGSGATVQPGTGSATEGAVGGWHFDNDQLAIPLYDQASIGLGDGANKFFEYQFLQTSGQFAQAQVKKSEACADVNIALLNLATANRNAALPGSTNFLAPFGSQMLLLYNNIKTGRLTICI